MSNWLQNIFGPADPVDLSKAPPEPPTPEEMVAEYKRALEQAEAARDARRNSLPNILRQHAFNDAMHGGGFVLSFNGPLINSTCNALLNEAADEIDRLRRAIAALKMEAGIPHGRKP